MLIFDQADFFFEQAGTEGNLMFFKNSASATRQASLLDQAAFFSEQAGVRQARNAKHPKVLMLACPEFEIS